MGNSAKKAKKQCSSPAQDALQTIRLQWCTDSPEVSQALLHNSKDHNESFVSFESFTFDDNPPTASDSTINEHVSGHVESPEQLNIYNLHGSFLSSFLNATSMDSQPEVQSLYDVVKSHLWSIHSQEYVTMCASNILSILKIYGECVPKNSEVINQKSQFMFHILDCLHAHISQMKTKHGHSRGFSDCKSCHGCDTKLMVLKHIVLRNALVKDNFCLICLEFFPKGTYLHHKVLTNHVKVKSKLIEDIYPFPCSACQLRFAFQKDLDFHSALHVDSLENCNKAHDVKVFEPVCCYLCKASFSDEKSLEKHELKSLEHGFRKEIAMEVALRVQFISDRLCKSDSNPTCGISSSRNLSPEANCNNRLEDAVKDSALTKEHNATKTVSMSCGDESEMTSHPTAPDSMYYCCPCEVYVPKANVINHESGQRHSQCCKAWVRLFQKAPQVFEKPRPNQDLTTSTVKPSSSDLSKNPTSDKKVPSKNSSFIEKDCSTAEVIKDIANAKAPIEDNNCLSTEAMKETSKLVAPIVDRNCSPVEAIKETVNTKTPLVGKDCSTIANTHIVSEESFTNEEMSLVTDEHIRQKIEEYFALEKTIVCRSITLDGYYSCKQCPSARFLYYPVMLSHVTGKGHLKLLPVLDQRTVDRKVDILDYLVSIKSQKNKHLLTIVNRLSAKRVIQYTPVGVQDVASTLTELKPPITSIAKNALTSVPNVSSNCSKLKTITPVQCDQSLDSTDLMSTLFPSKMNKVSQLGVLCHSEESSNLPKQTRAIADNISKCAQSDAVPLEVIESQILKDRNNVHDCADVFQHSSKNGKESPSCPESLDRAQDRQPSLSPDALISEVEALVIGEETGTTLQDQLHQACPGKDISDCEMQCGICGEVFQIYNGDLDLSLDMHVNDPQHLLATEVPSKRDPQSMAETAKTTNVLEKSKTEIALASSRKVSITDISSGKRHVIAEVFSLEQKNIETNERNYYCKLCRVYAKNDTQFVHHLLFPQHLSEKWLNDLTDEEVSQKLQKLKSLLNKYKYAGVALQSALQRISSMMTKQNRLLSERIGQPGATSSRHQSSKVVGPRSSRIFVSSTADDSTSVASCSGSSTNHCEFCSKNLSSLSHLSRLNHNNSCKLKVNTLGAKSNPGVAVPLTGSLETVSSHVGSKRRPHHFCDICKKRMDINDKKYHELGKGHQTNLLLYASRRF